jgi:hypothetical protein
MQVVNILGPSEPFFFLLLCHAFYLVWTWFHAHAIPNLIAITQDQNPFSELGGPGDMVHGPIYKFESRGQQRDNCPFRPQLT